MNGFMFKYILGLIIIKIVVYDLKNLYKIKGAYFII